MLECRFKFNSILNNVTKLDINSKELLKGMIYCVDTEDIVENFVEIKNDNLENQTLLVISEDASNDDEMKTLNKRLKNPQTHSKNMVIKSICKFSYKQNLRNYYSDRSTI